MEDQIIIYAAAAYAIASEIIGLVPKWKSNSVVQLIMNVFKQVIGGK